MSFVAPGHRKEKIHKHGHMHLDDFVERRDRFQNELIIAAHFSTRYHDKQVAALRRRRRCRTCSAAGCICGSDVSGQRRRQRQWLLCFRGGEDR